jgi:hypothetical protein
VNPEAGFGIRDEHTESYFENFVSVFWVKILYLFDADLDPGSRILSTLDPGYGVRDGQNRIRDKHPVPQHCCTVNVSFVMLFKIFRHNQQNDLSYFYTAHCNWIVGEVKGRIRIRIQIHIKVTTRIRIRIRIKVTTRIRILMRIRNTNCKSLNRFRYCFEKQGIRILDPILLDALHTLSACNPCVCVQG